jgi:hypothetical protein
MAYTDFDGKTIVKTFGRTRMTLAATAKVGDLVNRDGTLADANANKPGNFVVVKAGASGDVVTVARAAEVEKRDTLAVGGAATAGSHSGTIHDLLYLSATAGKYSETPVAGVTQVVGHVLSTQRLWIEPAQEYDDNTELVSGTKTLDEQDSGKVIYITADAFILTLPATVVGTFYTIVNGMQDADALVSVSPNASDQIIGPDYAGTDNKDWQNTKATARAGDRIEIVADGAQGWFVTKLKGTWAQES